MRIDIKKVSLVKSLWELQTIAVSLSHNNKHKPQISKERDQDEYKLTLSERYQRKTTVHAQSSRFTFYTENIFCKLLCKPKDRMIAEDESNFVYEIDCSICKGV